MNARHLLGAALAGIVLLVTACGDAADKRLATSAESATSDVTSLRVMAFNIEYGGTHVLAI